MNFSNDSTIFSNDSTIFSNDSAIFNAFNVTDDPDSSLGIGRAGRGSKYMYLKYLLILVFYGFGLVGNICAVVILSSRRSDGSIPLTLLRCLAWTDLCAIAISAIISVIGLSAKSAIDMRLYCHFKVFTNLLMGYFSQCLATCMAVERCFAMSMPFKYTRTMTPRFIQAALVFFGLFTIALSSLTFASPSPSHTELQCESSWQSWDSFDVIYSYAKAVSGLVLSLIIVVANCVTVIYLFRMQVRQKKMTPDVILQGAKAGGRRDSKQLKAERSFAKILVILSLVCLVCWTPFMLIIVINASGIKTSKSLDYYGSFLVGMNFVLDPYIYILIKQQYRQRVVSCFKTMCCWLCRWRRRGRFREEMELEESTFRTSLAMDIHISPFKDLEEELKAVYQGNRVVVK
ncbi:prostaglandin E2 receptor EP4 subtype-like isoform X2 [Lineus longissimus]|uniref:prostaglandin E2 receptor EP4 subtype-like isoform X2 n=1 Tax=Lineus longissimus TaxID=88925 RepID=UPI00315C4F06